MYIDRNNSICIYIKDKYKYICIYTYIYIYTYIFLFIYIYINGFCYFPMFVLPVVRMRKALLILPSGTMNKWSAS